MKILHILEDYSLNSGGLRTVVQELNKKLRAVGIESYIISTDSETEDNIYLVPNKKTPWRYTLGLKNRIIKIINEKKINIVHIHGVWMYPQFIASKIAIKYKIPFIITPHGMYEPWLWNSGTLKKKIYFKFFANSLFKRAKVIHGITEMECRNLNLLFPNNKVTEIPNLIDYKNYSIIKLAPKDSTKYILYLGRIDKKKGIDILIKAFSKLKNDSIKLKIAGEFTDYKKKLDKLIVSLNIKNKVIFLGRITGIEKKILFKNAIVFVAPSHSEVIGMVNLEAAITKTPVITTYQTGLGEEWSNNGGKLINPNVKELYLALEEVLQWTNDERINNGEKLYDFALKNYSWDERIKDWIALYRSLNN